MSTSLADHQLCELGRGLVRDDLGRSGLILQPHRAQRLVALFELVARLA